MFHDIHVLLYDIRYALLILLIPMTWSAWVFWAYFTSPGTIGGSSSGRGTGRHSHRLKARHKGQQSSTMTSPGGGSSGVVGAATATAQSEGRQGNLLDALSEGDEDGDDEVVAVEDESDSYQKDYDHSDSKNDLVDQLVDDVADKVAAQIEALTGEAVYDDTKAGDMQDLLDTIEEDSSTDEEVISDSEAAVEPIGEHTAAIRKASKMEEIGFHKSTEDEEAELDEAAAKLLDSPELKGLGAKHLARISDMGLADAPGDEKERLRTEQLDDILGKLDAALETPELPAAAATDPAASAVPEADTGSDEASVNQQDMEDDDAPSFGTASTQTLKPITETDIEEARARDDTIAGPEPVSAAGDSDTLADEAGAFFENLDAEVADDSDPYDEDPTIREESGTRLHGVDHAATEDSAPAATDGSVDDEAADFMGSLQDADADEYDQLETVKVQDAEADDAAVPMPEESESSSKTTSALLKIQDGDQRADTDAKSVEITDDDLPAWARADSFDDDEEDGDKPKQQNLFD